MVFFVSSPTFMYAFGVVWVNQVCVCVAFFPLV